MTIDEAFGSIKEYINGPEGKAVQNRLDNYRAKAREEGRMCESCDYAMTQKEKEYSFAHYRKTLCPRCYPKS